MLALRMNVLPSALLDEDDRMLDTLIDLGGDDDK